METPQKLSDWACAVKRTRYFAVMSLLTTRPTEEVDQEPTRLAIVARREAVGISRAELARRIDVSDSYLFDLENGKRNWSAALVAKVEAALKA